MSAQIGSASRTSVAPRPAGATTRPVGWVGFLRKVMQAIETRQHLLEMDDRMLKDIGLGRADAEEEANRAPWDLTQRRL